MPECVHHIDVITDHCPQCANKQISDQRQRIIELEKELHPLRIVRTQPIIGEEVICPDGYGRVIGFDLKSPRRWIQVATYVNDRSCQWDADNIEFPGRVNKG